MFGLIIILVRMKSPCIYMRVTFLRIGLAKKYNLFCSPCRRDDVKTTIHEMTGLTIEFEAVLFERPPGGAFRPNPCFGTDCPGGVLFYIDSWTNEI